MDVQRRSRGSATLPRHACQHADTSIRGAELRLEPVVKLISKNNDSTKVWENLTEANEGHLPCQPLDSVNTNDWIRRPPLQRRVYTSMRSKGLYDSCITSFLKREFSNALPTKITRKPKRRAHCRLELKDSRRVLGQSSNF